jgi:hypothetical protein
MGDSLCAIAYLGQLPEGDVRQLSALLDEGGYLPEYNFLADLTGDAVVQQPGDEVYCLVPRDEGASLTVREYLCNEENGYQGEAGETLYTGSGPVILIGNESDIIPNLTLTLVGTDGQKLDYVPSLSLCDGKVDLPAAVSVYDFSKYTTQTVNQEAGFLGTWSGTLAESGVSCTLAFYDDGTMTWQGSGGTALAGTYYVVENSSKYPDGAVVFEMTSSAQVFWGVYQLDPTETTLTVTRLAGDKLVESGDTLTLTEQDL